MVRCSINKQCKKYLKSAVSYASVISGSPRCERFQASFLFPLDLRIRHAKANLGFGWTQDSIDAESWLASQGWVRRHWSDNPSFLRDLLSKGLDSSRYVTNLRKETSSFKKHAFQLSRQINDWCFDRSSVSRQSKKLNLKYIKMLIGQNKQ